MPVIPVIGPSHAGKTTLVGCLVNHASQYGFSTCLTLLDLDKELGSDHRSDGIKACKIIEERNKTTEIVLADCGAGLTAFSGEFLEFLTSAADYPRSLIVVWCNKQTFRNRHSENELGNNYNETLSAIWETARSVNRLVNTSEGISCQDSAQKMALIVKEIVSAKS